MKRSSALRAPLFVLLLPLGACIGQMAGDSSPSGSTGSNTTPGAPGSTAGPGAGPNGNAPAGTQPGQPAAPGATTPAPTAPPLGFEPLPPAAYAAKVKDLLTGLPLTDEERRAVVADPRPDKVRPILKGLIDKWMGLDQFKDKMFKFFKSAFQQTQLDRSDLEDQLRISELPGSDQTKLLKAVEEMFARTVLELIREGRPFTETATTTRFMMNTPLMVALAYMDAAPKGDTGNSVASGYWLLNKYGARNFKFQMVTNVDPVTGLSTPIPFEETIDPNHPNFMKFVFRQPDPMRYMPCRDPIVVTGTSAISYVMRGMYGSRQACQGAQTEAGVFTPQDWNDWRMVTVRPPAGAEERTTFWDLPKVRTAKELVLAMPRVGFMTTVAFFANWPTNPSNQYRVTINQALIVGLGKSFDDTGTTVQVAETSVDALHIQPGTACFGCHQTLDPMRDFYKQTYSLYYFQQLDMNNPKNPIPATATFAVDDTPPTRGRGIADLAKAMIAHPRFPIAWTQKLCTLANSEMCLEDDPEFRAVSDAFKKSNFDFKTLIRELYSSPIVTFAAETKTAKAKGVIMSIARRETFCARLSNRLGYRDVCNESGESQLPRIASQARSLSLGVPGSAYSRADEHPMMPHDPNMFFIDGTEKICWAVAGQLVDATPVAGQPPKWSARTPQQRDQAILEFVENVMGVPASDPKHGPLIDVLNRHYTAAVAAKETPADSLRSTFVAACASPLGVSSGL